MIAHMIGWLLDTLFVTGALMAGVLALRRPAARMFGPGIAYALWVLPLIRLVLPPLVLPVILRPAVRAVEVPATVYPDAVSLASAHEGQVLGQGTSPVTVLIALWLGGVILFLGWRAWSYLAMRRSLLEGARPMGEAGTVRIVESAAVASPVAFGIRDKVIALPLGFLFRTETATRNLAIAHELEHHAGRDLAVNVAFQFLLALHWFDPLAWLAWRAMRQDQEAACDARVLAGRSGEERVRYGHLIASLAAGPRLALAAPMAGAGRPLVRRRAIVHRLRRIAAGEVTRRRRLAGRTALTLGVMALPLTASISYAANDEGGGATGASPARQFSGVPASDIQTSDIRRSATPHDMGALSRGNGVQRIGSDRVYGLAKLPSGPEPGWSGEGRSPALPAPPMTRVAYGATAGEGCSEARNKLVDANGKPDRAALAQLDDSIRREVDDALQEGNEERSEALREAAIERSEALRESSAAEASAHAGQAAAREAVRQARAEVDREQGLSRSIRQTVNNALESAFAGTDKQS